MAEYLLLTRPSANRVYGDQSGDLTLAELAIVGSALHAPPTETAITNVGGVDYVRVESAALDDQDRFVLSNLSSAYALYERGSGGALHPLAIERLAHYPSDLITIQRFTGKTNEEFTHLLVNVAVAVSTAATERARGNLQVRLLDPVAGRGTTLNRALMYGFDSAGIELDTTDFEAYRTFLTTYLKDKRLRFKLEEEAPKKGPLAGTKRFVGRIDGAQRVEVVRGDTAHASRFFAARSFDVLVADLPYGVHHRATTPGAAQRSPHDLVAASAGEWRALLRSGAGIALSWNVKTLDRSDLETVLVAAGFKIVDTPRSFRHRVDRAITRDVVLATT